jgi:hypothetical protein
VTLNGNRRQTDGPLNQWRFARGWAAKRATVHIQRAKEFATLGNDTGRTEYIQAKKCSVIGNGGDFAGIVLREGNVRNYIANLAIESGAYSIQQFRKGSPSRNGLKKLLLPAQQILEFVIGIAMRQLSFQVPTRTIAIFIHESPPFRDVFPFPGHVRTAL